MIPESLKCPACGNYPDTPGHELGCPTTFVGGVPHGLSRDDSGERWQLDEGDTGVPILPYAWCAVDVASVSPPLPEMTCGAVRLDVSVEEPLPPLDTEPHVHLWVHHQNVTTNGTAMPPYQSCVCGAARPVPLDVDFVGSDRQYAVLTERADNRLRAELAAALTRAEEAEESERMIRDIAVPALADVKALADELEASPLVLRRDVGKRLRAILTTEYGKRDEAARAKAEAALADWRRGHRPSEWERVADELAAALRLLLGGGD